MINFEKIPRFYISTSGARDFLVGHFTITCCNALKLSAISANLVYKPIVQCDFFSNFKIGCKLKTRFIGAVLTVPGMICLATL